jgi:putative heme-binding domain-containing protein
VIHTRLSALVFRFHRKDRSSMMTHQLCGLRAAFLGVLGLLAVLHLDVQAQKDKAPTKDLQWIWFDEAGEPPAETRYFRKTFTVAAAIEEATLDITADNHYVVWLNGKQAGAGDEWKNVNAYDVKKLLVEGKNVITVEGKNDGGPAGLLVRLTYKPKGGAKTTLVSDASWKSAKTAADGWQKADFDESKWTAAKVVAPYGGGPWQDLVWESNAAAAGPLVKSGRFKVPEGFKVEEIVRNPYTLPGAPKKPFSLINMCFDAKGRLLVSEEGGPTLLCSSPDTDGVLQDVKPYCPQVTSSHGMCWVDDALYLVGNGPKGTGLYRCRDTKGADVIDEVTLIHAFNGGIGEHGPHAVIHGPDNFLYVVIGNHAHANVDGKQCQLADNSPLLRWPTGGQGPKQGEPSTTEDVLLPRQNDANGHAANLRAPGGTIWRMDRDGKQLACVAAGFRNEFDAAFSPTGELFTFDSDMEWDEALPWYRPVRICHVPMGAEFGWRTGSSKIPPYALDTLPATYDTGRGSPVGVEFYDHVTFPEKYHGCCFMADWSLGILYAVFPKRDGASYKAEVEKFCTGSPMNITDCAVASDGSLYFTLGGRGSQGGVYRVSPSPQHIRAADHPIQPLSAWGRARIAAVEEKQRNDRLILELTLTQDKGPGRREIGTLFTWQNFGQKPGSALLTKLVSSKEAELRGYAVYLLGVNGYPEGKDTLIKALKDKDKLVQRRACEALIRAGIEPPVDALWPLLADSDRFLRTAARLVLQRIDPANWADKLWSEKNDRVAWEGIIALCKIDKAAPYAEQVFARLKKSEATSDDAPAMLDWLRTVQMALVHAGKPTADAKAIAVRCGKMFPAEDKLVSRELAIVLTHCRKERIIDTPVHAELLKALKAAEGDRAQQIHYFYCLRLLHDGWTPEQKEQLFTWLASTQDWTGGSSFSRFLANILRDLQPIFSSSELAAGYERLSQAKPTGGIKELKAALIDGLVQSKDPQVQTVLRGISDKDPTQTDAVARALLRYPTAENWLYLVRGLGSPNKATVVELSEVLKKMPNKPKADEPASFRLTLEAASRFDEKDKNRWKLIELLRHWGVRDFGADQGDSKTELTALARWFGQTFPQEKPLPGALTGKPAESKYKYAELLAFLQNDPQGKKGDPLMGRVVFEKATCLKCHKYGKEGEGIGPDLSTVSKRFKRDYILESILDPSKVISDQYRSSTILTKKGVTITGLAAPQGDTVTVLQSDGSKVTLKKDEIEQQVASLISVMPEKLLDNLTKQEIADLFAFLESEPK